jgi:hemerythrin superfamily protein
MDILELLRQEHKEVGDMLDQCQQHDPGDAELDDLAKRITQALTIHAELEEKLFYPVLRERAEDADERVDVFEAYTEHDLVKRLLALLAGRRRNPEQFKAQLQVLGENVKHHVKEEESTIFSLTKELLDDDERDEIGTRW